MSFLLKINALNQVSHSKKNPYEIPSQSRGLARNALPKMGASSFTSPSLIAVDSEEIFIAP